MIDCSYQANVPNIDQHTVIITCICRVLSGEKRELLPMQRSVLELYIFHQYRTRIRLTLSWKSMSGVLKLISVQLWENCSLWAASQSLLVNVPLTNTEPQKLHQCPKNDHLSIWPQGWVKVTSSSSWIEPLCFCGHWTDGLSCRTVWRFS